MFVSKCIKHFENLKITLPFLVNKINKICSISTALGFFRYNVFFFINKNLFCLYVESFLVLFIEFLQSGRFKFIIPKDS